MMANDAPFIDYYSVLQIGPDCDTKRLDSTYRHLAKLFHPDHPETADVIRFNEVIDAYRALRDPKERAKYDLVHSAATGFEYSEYFTNGGTSPEQKEALDDAEAHELILRLLYKMRRENASEPGCEPYTVQEAPGCSDEAFAFHMWTLRRRASSGPLNGAL